MQKKKIKFIDFWPHFNHEKNWFTRILRKYYDVEITDDADYVFFSCFDETHWDVPDKCIKIYFTGENVVPDFNACDYGVGFEWMEYEDRYIRIPLYYTYPDDILFGMANKHIIPDNFDLAKEKPEFCSFVISNEKNKLRNNAFHAISQYKRVNSGGRTLNNIGGPVSDKLAFNKKHKFTICFENAAHSGYTTEKIADAFAARTVPIYWGDPTINKVFNIKAFINASDFENLDALVEYVKMIDSDDDLYMSILRQPALLGGIESLHQDIAKYESWLINIFDQPIHQAYRRARNPEIDWYIKRRLIMNTLKHEERQAKERINFIKSLPTYKKPFHYLRDYIITSLKGKV